MQITKKKQKKPRNVGEKLLIFHIHKTKLIFALFAIKILAGGKNIKQSLPYQKKLNGQSLIRYDRHTRNNMSNHNIT